MVDKINKIVVVVSGILCGLSWFRVHQLAQYNYVRPNAEGMLCALSGMFFLDVFVLTIKGEIVGDKKEDKEEDEEKT